MQDLNHVGVAPPSPNAIEPSPLQRAIFDTIQSGNDLRAGESRNVIIEAVAGSGKTWTIVRGTRYLPSNERSIFVCFNKSIQQELSVRLPPNIEAKTFHSYGLQVIRQHLGGSPKVNFRKVADLMDEIFGKGIFAKKFGDKIACGRLISFAKGNGHMYDEDGPTHEEWQALIDYHDLQFEADPSIYFNKLRDVYVTSLNWTDEIDFDDMLLHPVYHQYSFIGYDNIIVDEAQDLNSLQHIMLSKMRESDTSRIIAVGDTHQAIYGFRGADSSSMGNLKKLFNMKELPLNVSYRCSKVVRDMAQEYVPHFESLPDAPEGTCDTIFDLPDPNEVPPDAMVLCRLNAPLFRYGMTFLNKGVRVQLWTNLDNQLKSRIKSFKATQTKQWLSQLGAWYQKEREDAENEEKFHRVQSLKDIYETLTALAEGTSTVKQIERNLSNLTDSNSGPILSTVHKAKGHEAETVLIVEFNRMPSRFAKKKWMMNQEHNLIYVALTRAKRDLILHMQDD